MIHYCCVCLFVCVCVCSIAQKRCSIGYSAQPLLLPHLSEGYGQHRHLSSSQSLLWQPRGSQRQNALLASSKRLLPEIGFEERGGSSHLSYSSMMHYKRANGLVESKELLSGARPRQGRVPRPARTLACLQSPIPPPPLPTGMGLPPQLMKYITEVWRKHVNDL